MKFLHLLQSSKCYQIFGFILVLSITQSLGLPGAFVNSSFSNDDSLDQTITSYMNGVRSRRSPSSSNSNGTNSQDHLPVSFGLLFATTNSSTSSYCIAHFNYLSIAHKPDTFYRIIRVEQTNLCSPAKSKVPFVRDDSGVYVLIDYNAKCPISEQALNVVNYFPTSIGLIISLPNDVNVYNLYVQKNITDPKFIIALIGVDSTAEIISKYGSQARAMIYQPNDEVNDRGIFESSLIGIWFIAVFTVAIGGFSSGVLRYGLFLTQQLQDNQRELAQALGENEGNDGERRKKKTKLDDSSLDVTPTTVIFFVIYMCIVLLILYFFYSYLVFMMIIFFVVFCTISIYSLIMGLTVNYVAPLLIGKWAQYGWRIGVTLVSLIAPMVWFFIRKSSQAWSIQNSLAMIFCIHVLQMLRFPNFRITSLLLSLLFVYDIFFVFLTPFLTSDGESIMVKVATGGSSSESSYSFGAKTIGESLPVVFQWPRSMTSSVLIDKCYQGRVFWTSKLGFGDVLVPGFLVSYCHALDLFQKTPYRLYFVVECIFYGLGLIITFVALHLMNSAQPALLYLVPATLIPPLFIAWWRKEMNILWYGPEPAAIEALKRQRQSQANEGETRPALNNVPIEPSEPATASNNMKESLVNDQSNDAANHLNLQNS